jgi:adenylate cyclase class IV
MAKSNKPQSASNSTTIREVERKYLIDTPEKMAKVVSELAQWTTGTWEAQLNHYFFADTSVVAAIKEQLNIKGDTPDVKLSLRTRSINKGLGILVVKYGKNPENGEDRTEETYQTNLTIQELDRLIEDCGGSVRSKWSRERVTYTSPQIIVTLDRNAGYGPLLEVEATELTAEREDAFDILDNFAARMDLTPLEPERLERMFQYYEAHWRDYYGTTNVFHV